MKIEFEFDKNGPVSLLKNIPDFPRLKLLGYNGIGKTLTANVLASISGQAVWSEQKKIDSLSRFLPIFTAKIQINKELYKIETQIKKWKIDPLSGRLKPDSIGLIKLNGSKISTEEFWKKFKCHIIRGNEDIHSHIEVMANNLENTIISNINNLKKKVIGFAHKLDNLQNLLSQNDLHLEIIDEIEEIEEVNPQEFESNILDVIEGFILAIKQVNNFDWLSLEGPKEASLKLTQLNGELKENLKLQKSQINSLRQKIPNKDDDEIKKCRGLIEEIEDKLQKIETQFPLNKDEYPTPELTKTGKSNTLKEIEELQESLEEYNEHHFRREYWNSTLKYLDEVLNNYNLNHDTLVLLKTKKFSSINAKELKEWHKESAKKSYEKLEKLEEFRISKEKVEKLKEKLGKFDEHEEKLTEEEELKKKSRVYREKYENIISNINVIKKLPKMESEYIKSERESTTFDVILTQLESLSECENWSTLIQTKEPLNNYKELIGSLSDLSESVKVVKKRRKDIEKKKKKYIDNVKTKSKKLNIPDLIQKLIDSGDVITLCKLCLSLPTIHFEVLEELQRECTDLIRFIIDKNIKEGVSDGQESFILETNRYLGSKLMELLNEDAFREHVFGGNKVTLVDPQRDILKYEDKDNKEYEKFITDYSTGQKAFAFSLASIFFAKQSAAENNILILDEFGAMLAEDKEDYLFRYLNDMQKKENWPSQYVVVLPYKGEFKRQEYAKRLGKKIEQLKKNLSDGGYAFEKL